ncbi:transcriptional regulator of met regulon [Saonia flava]|uniref:Transcriptional regulator of met regulon n=1 Tax=Saonia flava TaxID=523696 RepID=A0A846QZ10_9FLAO|nr:hypothetical protein [Saonia flava]NJB71882.1 transcriptional regulator of met regulon [Saonia flava]
MRFPKSVLVILFMLFKSLSVISPKKEHPYGNQRKKYEQIGAISINVPICVYSINRKTKYR